MRGWASPATPICSRRCSPGWARAGSSTSTITGWSPPARRPGPAPGPRAGPSLGPAVDVLLAHLGLLYLLAVFALLRRQGPAWREAAPAAGSAGAFLLGLGPLHDRLGHHAAAAWMLLARSRELDRDLALPADLERRAAAAGREELLALAREVAHLRRPRSPP